MSSPLSIPFNVPCPCRCTFCYETKFSKLFPWIKTVYIPPYNEKRFKFCQNVHSRQGALPTDGLFIRKAGNQLQYFPHCDFFALGLTDKQIEALVLSFKSSGKSFLAYTTGYNADLKFVKYLSSKYPDTFRMHLSIVTFDPWIRKNLMNPDIDVENVKRLSRVISRPVYFLMYFNKEQVASDVALLNESSVKTHGTFYFHRLYYNKLSPEYIINYSDAAERNFREIIYYLKSNDDKLKGISRRLILSPDSKIYAWTWKEEIKKLLKGCRGTDKEAIFCSYGAYEVIRSVVSDKTHVIPVKSCFGGCVDFTLGLTVKSIVEEIKKLLESGAALRRIYLPDSMFCAEGKFDLNCDSIELIKKAYPKLEVKVIKIPSRILKSTINLDFCLRYYKNRIKLGLPD